MMYNPYSTGELDELERAMRGMGSPMSMMEPAPLAQPEPIPMEQPAPYSLPTITAPAPKKTGMVTTGRQTEGIDEGYRTQLIDLHRRVAQGEVDAATAATESERIINERNMGRQGKTADEAGERVRTSEIGLVGQQDKQQKLQEERSRIAAVKESPALAFEGMEWAGVLAAIGMASETYFNAVGKQNTTTLSRAFNEHVDRSIAAQREQKMSMLNDLTQQLGDSHAAEGILRESMWKAIDQRAAAEQERAQSQDALDRLGAIRQKAQVEAEKSLVGAMERMAPREAVSSAPPKPVGSGVKSLEQQLKDQEAAQKLRQGKVTAAMDFGMNEAEANKFIDERFPELSALGRGKTTEQRSEAEKAQRAEAGKEDNADQAKAAGALAGAESYGKVMGLTRDPNTMEWRAGKDSKNPIAQGLREAIPFSSQRASKAKSVAIEGFGRLESGGVIGKEELSTFTDMVAGATTAEQLAESLNAIEVIVRPRLSKRAADQGGNLPSTIKRRVP